MKACGHCEERAEWRFKDGWGVLACAEWFTGKCEAEPLDVTPPSKGNLRPKGRGLDEDEKYNNWVKTRMREIWPLDIPRHSS
jgi:hypothetical protein